MRSAGVVPGPVTRAAVVVSLMAVVGGLLRIGVSAWRSRELYGLVPAPEPACVERGACVSDALAARRHEAWLSLVPGGVLVLVGLTLAVVVAMTLLLRHPWVGPPRSSRPGRTGVLRRLGRARVRHSPWGKVAVLAGTVTLCAGVLTSLPVVVGLLYGPPLSVAAAACGVAALVLLLVLVGRLHAPVPDSVVAAVIATIVTCLAVAASLWVTDAGAVSYGVLVVLLLLVPPAAGGVTTALGLRGLARLRRWRAGRLAPSGP